MTSVATSTPAPGVSTATGGPAGKPPLSVCVITLNEERHIARCLDSVAWAGETVVVDSGSSDRTVAIAREKGARVLHHDWPGWVAQKQFAVDHAGFDWVLCLDADEHPDAELAQAVQELWQQSPAGPPRTTSYRLRRRNEYQGRWMRYGDMRPDWCVRLFHRGAAHWGGIDPHDRVETAGPVTDLPGCLLHHPYRDLADEQRKLERYSTTMARELHARGLRGSVARAYTRALWAWTHSYLLRRGFLDGRAGALRAATYAGYTFMKYAKLEEMEPRRPGGPPAAGRL